MRSIRSGGDGLRTRYLNLGNKGFRERFQARGALLLCALFGFFQIVLSSFSSEAEVA